MVRPRTSEEHKREKARLRKRKERLRKKEARSLRPVLADGVYDLIQDDFSQFLQSHFDSTVEEGLHAGGVLFEGDLRNEIHSGVYPEDELWEEDFGVPLNSLNRTVVMIEGMLDAAKELARLVNEFKMQEVNRVIAEAEARSAKLIEIEKLYRFKARLTRTVQVRLPVYWVDGG